MLNVNRKINCMPIDYINYTTPLSWKSEYKIKWPKAFRLVIEFVRTIPPNQDASKIHYFLCVSRMGSTVKLRVWLPWNANGQGKRNNIFPRNSKLQAFGKLHRVTFNLFELLECFPSLAIFDWPGWRVLDALFCVFIFHFEPFSKLNNG